MEDPTTLLLLICAGVLALAFLILLFIFGSFSTMVRQLTIGLAVKVLNMGRGEKEDKQKFAPKAGHDSLGDILVERSEDLNFEAAVARHGGASTGTGIVQAQDATPDDDLQSQSKFGRALDTVRTPFVNVRDRLRAGNPSPPPLPEEGDIDADI